MAINQRHRRSDGFGLSSIGERTTGPLPNTAITAIDRSNISITLLSAPSTIAPGETGEITVRVENTASSIPSDDPFFCRDRNGVAGVAVTVGGALTLEGVGEPTPQFEQRAFCSTPGESRLMTVSFTAPNTTGTYIGFANAGWHDPPQHWDGTDQITVQVQESDSGNGGNGDTGGCTSDTDCGFNEVCQGGVCVPVTDGGDGDNGGDQPGGGEQLFGFPRDQVLIAGGLAGLGLGAAALLS